MCQVCIAKATLANNSPNLCGFQRFRRLHCDNFDLVALAHRVGYKLRNRLLTLADDQTRQQGNRPSGLRTLRFNTIEKSFGAPSMTVGLNTELVDFFLSVPN